MESSTYLAASVGDITVLGQSWRLSLEASIKTGMERQRRPRRLFSVAVFMHGSTTTPLCVVRSAIEALMDAERNALNAAWAERPPELLHAFVP